MTYNETAVEELVSQMVDLGPALVLLEATGGLDVAGGSAGRCGAAGGGGQPGQVRDFARATGTLAQTDALDAAVLAHFAEAVDLPCVLCEKPRPRSSTPWLAEGIRC